MITTQKLNTAMMVDARGDIEEIIQNYRSLNILYGRGEHNIKEDPFFDGRHSWDYPGYDPNSDWEANAQTFSENNGN